MLDKTVPYFNVIMKRGAGEPISAFDLPPGFSWTWFMQGRETEWASIETSIGEFISAREAIFELLLMRLQRFRLFLA